MIVSAGLENTLPPEFDEECYRRLNADLRDLTVDGLRAHYEQHGRRDGRRAHSVVDRAAFVGLIPKGADVLEIAPFADPLVEGAHVRYFDVLDRNALIERATRVGYPTRRIPDIHYVSPSGDLGVVDATFDCVLSSHVIEHQPDLIGHLQQVQRLLRPGGFYFLLIPDKSYCFDHFLAESTVADAIDAHFAERKVHTLRSVVEHEALTTHKDAKRHWAGDHGSAVVDASRVRRAVAMFVESARGYLDVHAWYFSPASFRDMLSVLRELDYTRFVVSRVYPTLRGNNEFWAVLSLPRT